MQHLETAARQVASTQQLKPIGSASDMQDLGRGPQDAQRQTVARRMCTPNRGPKDVQNQRIGNKGGQVLHSEGLPRARPEIRGWVLRVRGVSGCCTSSGALRFSFETERVELSRGAATSRRPKGFNCESARHPHCGREATRKHSLKTSRAAALRRRKYSGLWVYLACCVLLAHFGHATVLYCLCNLCGGARPGYY